ncbi:MAG: sulfate adenylyltransferase subunit CysD [Candidatus Aenigmatarchaeota archaeon]
MDHLDELESRSIYIIREAYREFKHIAMLWSIGKDSSTLLWLCRKAFYGKIPFPIIHIDTSYKFKEMIEWRDQKAKEWDLKMIISQNKEALAQGMGPQNKVACCTALKTEALKQTIKEHKFRALLLGIRRDEHGVRAKERVFSPRNIDFKWDYKNQPPELWDQYKLKAEEQEHIRVHPLLHWTEIDIWEYVEREKIPLIDLYLAKNGKRYRSIGCACCCAPVESQADTVEKIVEELKTTRKGERAGRAQDKEEFSAMQKLRALGYM